MGRIEERWRRRDRGANRVRGMGKGESWKGEDGRMGRIGGVGGVRRVGGGKWEEGEGERGGGFDDSVKGKNERMTLRSCNKSTTATPMPIHWQHGNDNKFRNSLPTRKAMPPPTSSLGNQ